MSEREMVEALVEQLRDHARVDPFVQNMVARLRHPESDAVGVIAEAIKAMATERHRLLKVVIARAWG